MWECHQALPDAIREAREQTDMETLLVNGDIAGGLKKCNKYSEIMEFGEFWLHQK